MQCSLANQPVAVEQEEHRENDAGVDGGLFERPTNEEMTVTRRDLLLVTYGRIHVSFGPFFANAHRAATKNVPGNR